MINAAPMRSPLVTLAAKPARAIRAGRFWLSPVVAKLSPRHGVMMNSYRLEEEGRYDEALNAWSKLKGERQSRGSAFRHTLRSAHLALKAGRYTESVRDFGVLFALNPENERVRRGLESSALRAARHAESTGQWLEAARMWSTYGRVTSQREKCIRNLRDSARYVAQSADSPSKMRDAVEAWGLLRVLDPESREARQGLQWCQLSLARAAEKASDTAAARKHWHALLELSPGDQRALDGLNRLNG